MRCLGCGFEIASGSAECPRCRRRLDPRSSTQSGDLAAGGATVTLPAGSRLAESFGESGWADANIRAEAAELQPGTVWGNRYEIERSLGEGGMGAVYLARDREIDRHVALKVIRPQMAGDPAILRRFRQELVLARKVTHPNVVRIFDLGVYGGLRCISMEYIDGRQLSALLEEKGRLAPREAAEIILRVCRGLAAVHAEGVVHRDLKPANIMIAADDRAVLMDFGIARAGDSPTVGDGARPQSLASQEAMTQIGALLGTPRYMSPEQARGEVVDTRSDLFAIGLILYELLTGDVPFQAKTLRETLQKRSLESAPAPTTRNPAIPKRLSEIVLKCLATRAEDRYANAGELAHALEVYLGIARPTSRWKWVAAAGVAALALAGAFLEWERSARLPAAVHAPLEVLIADLDNRTSDPVFNGSLEPMLSIAMEGASFINLYDRGDAHKLAAQLQPQASRLDASMARLLALREGISVVISGGIEPHNSRYRLSIQATDGSTGKLIKRSEVTANTKDEVLRSVGQVAADLRTALGDATPESAKLAAAETFSTASLQAAQKYAQAQELHWEGKWDEAVRQYAETIQLDPNFGRAYSGMASTLFDLGRLQEAQHDYEIALTKLDRMTDREKYRTRGGYFLLMRKDKQALEQFNALIQAYPADTAGIANRALVYFYERDMAAALREGRLAVQIYPNNVLQRNNVGLFAMYGGDFETAIRESQDLLKVSPRFSKALLCIALSQLGEGKPEEAEKTWQRLAGIRPSMAAMGLGDLALYQGRFSDAIRILPPAIAADLDAKNPSEAALKQVALAQAYQAQGAKSKALMTVAAALTERSDDMVAFPAAEIYLDSGETAQAQALASKLRTSFDPEPRAYAAILEALIQDRQKSSQAAVSTLQDAQKLSDTWLGRLELGRAYLQAGAFPEAESEFDNCIKRRGETSAVFLDDEPSFRYLPAAYYYRARAREGLHSAAAAEDYQAFLQMKARSEADPLVVDARRRLAKD